MQPRPRMPMQGGMGPGPFGPRNQMMNPGFNPFGGRNPMMGAPSNPFGGGNNPMMMGQMMGRPSPMNKGGGGLLSKILGGRSQAGGFMGMQGAGKAASGGGGLLQSLSNPGGLTSMLNNTQQVLKTAQSIGPMIQQYSPMIKNLPAMWKIYKGFKNASKATDKATVENNQSTDAAVDESSNHEEFVNSTSNKKGQRKNKQQQMPSKKSPYQKGSSVPKMYI
ncbi:hypothetical protein J7E79_11475 [Bacillus sp. ISL-40]|uniref:VrrA/YqfQ family protein n=1 Tax=unclassified Bacillus (in: firmicutes) TaxID=185979 RepID=UPI001BE90E73|nr:MULTISPECIES: VrrA/YqfQ family protein [unclassified Bacillus (in: firmicutes)]MBT2698034.1 hypothetical protein [Bacillus sp. ISL-40]MBT2721334.1 hypothetical protein [Bacillus sp. ISL-46]